MSRGKLFPATLTESFCLCSLKQMNEKPKMTTCGVQAVSKPVLILLWVNQGGNISLGLPLQQVFGLLPLGDLGSTVVVVLLPRRADVLRPVISWVLEWTDSAETERDIFTSLTFMDCQSEQ